MEENKKESYVMISKKALRGMAPAIVICAVLLSKGKPGETLLFLLGIGTGIYIGFHWRK
jgi:hypothetical protein